MRDRLKPILADVFDMPEAEVPDDASAERITNWDSLHHIELMMAIELEFGVKVSSEEMPGLLSVDAIEEYLREQGVVGSA
jgi:acyl carrier protein